MIGKLIDRLDSFFGRLHFRYLGLGALLAWVYCTWFANGIFNVGETRSAILSLWAIFPCTLVFGPVISPTWPQLPFECSL